MNLSQFSIKMLARSSDKSNWASARAEWRWVGLLFRPTGFRRCLCGRPLRDDVCLIENSQTGSRALIGACCAQGFMGWPSKNIFAAWQRVLADASKPFNEPFMEFAFANGMATEWEMAFYRDTWRLRVLSSDQSSKRRQINFKILRLLKQAQEAYEARRPSVIGPSVP